MVIKRVELLFQLLISATKLAAWPFNFSTPTTNKGLLKGSWDVLQD